MKCYFHAYKNVIHYLCIEYHVVLVYNIHTRNIRYVYLCCIFCSITYL